MGRADSRASAIFRRRTALSSCYRSPAPEDRYSRRVAFRPVVAELGSGAIKQEPASMANLPDAWVEDARNLDNAEQLLHSAHGILLETPAIGDFLRNETNKRIVVAPKGYGKTFLLKSKRILLQRNSENLSCLPDNQLVDATISDSPSLSQADVQRFVDYAFWCQVWSAALMVSVVKSSAKVHPLDPADFRSPVMRHYCCRPTRS